MRSWTPSVALAVLSAYLYVGLEWLFFATKPSFLSVMTWMERLEILALAPLLPVTLLAGLGVVGGLLALLGPRAGNAGLFVMHLTIALVWTGALLLLIDNFTLTVLHFGVRSASGWWVSVYFGLILLLLIAAFRWVRKVALRRGPLKLPALVLPAISVAVLIASGLAGRSMARAASAATDPGSQPNILFISSDGLSAASMSLYGYHRKTTPFLETLAPETLFCENAFSNAAGTGGSLTSMLTGKLPTETRMTYPPDILRGEDAYEHLPAILRSRGYQNFHLSIRHYADPFDFNFREAFDVSNGQERKGVEVLASAAALVGTETAYFLSQCRDRLESRMLHLAGIRSIPDVYAEVTRPEHRTPGDANKVSRLLELLEGARRPFFAQLHLLGTHGPRFRPPNPVFSRGKEQNSRWMTDFYDDAILAFDGYVERIFAWLRERNLDRNTLVVLHTDHAKGFKTGVRIPLLFCFPRGEFAGRIKANVQLLDVAPTVLDYLGARIPAWMTGRSLLRKPLDRLHPIIVATHRAAAAVKRGRVYEIDASQAGPPFYSLGRLRTVICDALFTLDLTSFDLSVSRVRGHTQPCAEDEIPDALNAQRLMIEHLNTQGYATDSISWPVAPESEVFGAIEAFVEDARRLDLSQAEIESAAWEKFGRRAVYLFNRKSAAGEKIPAWLNLMIEWAVERSRVEVVESQPAVQLEVTSSDQ